MVQQALPLAPPVASVAFPVMGWGAGPQVSTPAPPGAVAGPGEPGRGGIVSKADCRVRHRRPASPLGSLHCGSEAGTSKRCRLHASPKPPPPTPEMPALVFRRREEGEGKPGRGGGRETASREGERSEVRRDYGSVTPLILRGPGRESLKQGVRTPFKKPEFGGRSLVQ